MTPTAFLASSQDFVVDVFVHHHRLQPAFELFVTVQCLAVAVGHFAVVLMTLLEAFVPAGSS